jgi:phosphate-selective porin OprO/OprP
MKKRRRLAACFVACVLAALAVPEREAFCRDPAPDARAAERKEDKLTAAEADVNQPKPSRTTWNEYDGSAFTLRVGGGFLVDLATYDQSARNKDQLKLESATTLRDLRLLLSGRFKFMPVSYSLGYMYDAATESWRFRQTGLMFEIEKLAGSLFVGRTKEGFSTNKLMVGYNGWTMERAAANDAFLPILADGLKWTGRLGDHVVYNLGWFIDSRSENEAFNKNDEQFAARVVLLPLAKRSRDILHLAVETRYGAADDNALRFRSRPESFGAPYAVDTEKIPASRHIINGIEAYYRPGSLTFGMEYFLNKVTSTEKLDPLFHGGEIFASYLLTGETRPYNSKGAFFEAVSPERSLTEGGTGAVELVLRYSYVDLDSRLVAGGKFWRITPMVSWYVSNQIRLELAYGYSSLDRFGVVGTTQFLQTRLQLAL